MKRTIKLRPQETDLPERKVRLRLPGRLGAELALLVVVRENSVQTEFIGLFSHC